MNLQPKQGFSVNLFPLISLPLISFVLTFYQLLLLNDPPYSHNVYNHLEYHDVNSRNPYPWLNIFHIMILITSLK